MGGDTKVEISGDDWETLNSSSPTSRMLNKCIKHSSWICITPTVAAHRKTPSKNGWTLCKNSYGTTNNRMKQYMRGSSGRKLMYTCLYFVRLYILLGSSNCKLPNVWGDSLSMLWGVVMAVGASPLSNSMVNRFTHCFRVLATPKFFNCMKKECKHFFNILERLGNPPARWLAIFAGFLKMKSW